MWQDLERRLEHDKLEHPERYGLPRPLPWLVASCLQSRRRSREMDVPPFAAYAANSARHPASR